MGELMRSRLAIAAALIALVTMAGAGCTVFAPTEPGDRDAQFCITQNQGESLLCCPSPGLGCQAVEATN